MLTYCSKCEKHTYNECPKKLVMMTNTKVKGISRCATFSANKTFFDKIKDKDELEVIVSPFLID